MANYELIALVLALAVSLWHDGLGRAKAFGVGLMLEAEKLARAEVALAGGPEKMVRTVDQLLDRLPPGVRQALAGYAAIRGMTLPELLAEWCQRWYDAAVGAG